MASRRVAFWFVTYAFVIVMFGTTLPTPLYPIYERQYGLGPGMITLIYAVYSGGVIVALLLFGHLSDQVGRRRVLVPGILFSAASAVAFLVAGGTSEMFVGRVLSGFSAGIFTGTATAALVDLAPEGRRTMASLIAVAANIGGLGLGTLVSGLLAQFAPHPLRLPFAVNLALLVPAAVGTALAPSKTGGRAYLRVQRLRVPREVRPAFVPAVTAGFAGFAVAGLFSSVAPSFMVTVLGVDSPALAGLLLFALFASSAAGQMGVRAIPGPVRLQVSVGGLLVGVAMVAAALQLESEGLLFASAIVTGAAMGLVIGAGLAAINERIDPAIRGEVTSSFFVILYIAIALPVIGVGLAADQVGLKDAGVAFSVCVGILVLVVLARLLVHRDAP